MLRCAHKMFAAALLICYLFAVAGFNVHHCGESGRTYLALPFVGVSCEDIHPCDGCGHHCDDEEACCTNNICRIVLSGDNMKDACSTAVCATLLAPVFFDAPAAPAAPALQADGYHSAPAAGIPPGSFLSKYCVLRV